MINNKTTLVLKISEFLAITGPTIVIMQPFLPTPLPELVIVLQWIFIPIFIMWQKPKIICWSPLLLLMLLTLFTSINAITQNPRDFYRVTLPIFSSIIAFRFGAYVSLKNDLKKVWGYLIIGVTIFNLISFISYALASLDILDIRYIFQVVQRDEAFGVERFSYGNPIMVPCVTSKEHATAFIEKHRNKLNDICSNRDSVFNFFVDFHNQVNKRYGKSVLSYEEVYAIYNYKK